jgi:hypothetical protein
MIQLSKHEVRQVAGGQDEGTPIAATTQPFPVPVFSGTPVWYPVPVKNEP